MIRFLFLIIFITMLCSCLNTAERKVSIGMNPVNFDYQLEKRTYKDYPPVLFVEEIGTFNICIDSLNNPYFYTFKHKQYCGFMLQEKGEENRNDLKMLTRDSIHKENYLSLKEKIAALGVKEQFVSIGIPADTITNTKLYELISEIHNKNLPWKLRRLNKTETELLKR